MANPTIGPRVKAAVDAARELGNPEARLPLSVIVIEMALSQQDMPDTLKDRKYYHPKASSKMELGLKERYDLIESYKQDAIRQSKK